MRNIVHQISGLRRYCGREDGIMKTAQDLPFYNHKSEMSQGHSLAWLMSRASCEPTENILVYDYWLDQFGGCLWNFNAKSYMQIIIRCKSKDYLASSILGNDLGNFWKSCVLHQLSHRHCKYTRYTWIHVVSLVLSQAFRTYQGILGKAK